MRRFERRASHERDHPMRRPLGTGLPRLLTGNGTDDTIYDLTSAPSDLQSRVNLVTLYAFCPGGVPGGDTVEISLNGTLLTSFSIGTDLVAYQTDARAARKILDRFPMRGSVALTVTSSAVAGVQDVYIVGYVELEGVLDPPQPIRPFQPGALVSPYTYEPAYIAGGVPASIDVHAIEEGYIDEITLWVRATGVASPQLVIDDGSNPAVSMDLTTIASLTADQSMLLLDGIPIQGQGPNAGISIEGPAPADTIMVWGSFSRR
jgi:hypothetical protein